MHGLEGKDFYEIKYETGVPAKEAERVYKLMAREMASGEYKKRTPAATLINVVDEINPSDLAYRPEASVESNMTPVGKGVRRDNVQTSSKISHKNLDALSGRDKIIVRIAQKSETKGNLYKVQMKRFGLSISGAESAVDKIEKKLDNGKRFCCARSFAAHLLSFTALSSWVV